MFTVYALLDIRKPGRFQTKYVTYLYQPFYIGKSTFDSRIEQHKNEALRYNKKGTRPYKINLVLKMLKEFNELPYVLFDVSENEQDAYDIEEELTHLFGIYSDGGILTNVVHGGQGGTSGRFYAKDKEGIVYSVTKDDIRLKTGELSTEEIYFKNVTTFKDKNGNGFRCDINHPKVLSGEYVPFHTGIKRDNKVCEAISKGKLNYKFTETHLENLRKANIQNGLKQAGKKRNKTWKENISKSRFGEKSKVAKTWKVTFPNGDIVVFKGGLRTFASYFNLSQQRVKNYIDEGKIPYPTHTGHLTPEVYNCTGFTIERNVDTDINFCIIKME